MKHCEVCKATESDIWWKCCPTHTTEQGPDVLCETCANALHPLRKGMEHLSYGSKIHGEHIAKGLCDSISKRYTYCQFKAKHKGLHLSRDAPSGYSWITRNELPRGNAVEHERVYYVHDANCSKTNFTELNERGVKTCLDCAGIFDSQGNGVATTDKRFDENWVAP